ncbi:unnamed protein product [Mucor circinelloides]
MKESNNHERTVVKLNNRKHHPQSMVTQKLIMVLLETLFYSFFSSSFFYRVLLTSFSRFFPLSKSSFKKRDKYHLSFPPNYLINIHSIISFPSTIFINQIINQNGIHRKNQV